MDRVVMPQTLHRQHNVLRNHPPNTTVAGEITEADTIEPRKLGEMVEIINSHINETMAPITSNAKEARSRTINNTLITPGPLLIKYSQRKHSSSRIDMKGPRES